MDLVNLSIAFLVYFPDIVKVNSNDAWIINSFFLTQILDSVLEGNSLSIVN